jgi:YD repeat-containing protein
VKRKLIEWTAFAVVAIGVVFFVRWLVPWAVVRHRLVANRSTPLRFDPALRQRLRESDGRFAKVPPGPLPSSSGMPPCLVLPIQAGVGSGEALGRSVPASTRRSGREPARPERPVRDCLELVPGGTPLNAIEVDLRAGTPILVQTDLYLPGNPPIAFTRVVEPLSWWRSQSRFYLPDEYLMYPTGHRNPYTDQTVWLVDARGVLFRRISKGTGYADAVYAQTTIGGLFYRALEGWNGDGWDLDLPDGRTLVFPEAYYALRPQQGSMVGLIEPSGARLTLSRDREGNLHEVRSSDGRWMRLRYQGSFIVSLEDSAGERAAYSYDNQKRLASSTDTEGETFSYSYDRCGQLTAVENEKLRKVPFTVGYSGGWATSLSAARGPDYRISYRTGPDHRISGMDVWDDRGGHWTILLHACTDNGCGYEVHRM